MGILCLGARIGTASECTGNRPNPGSSTSHKDFGASVHFDGSGVRRPSEATQLPVVSTADGLAIKQRNSGDELAQDPTFDLQRPTSSRKKQKLGDALFSASIRGDISSAHRAFSAPTVCQP